MSHLRAIIVVVVLILVGWLGFKVWRAAPSTSEIVQENHTIDEMEKDGLPDFSAKNLFGKEINLKSYSGQVIVLNFWASWCTPCVEEVPSLIKLVKAYRGKIHLFAISGDNSKEDIEIFLKSFPELKDENIDIIWDEDHTLMKKYGVARLPESFVGNKDLKLAKKLVGSIDWYTSDAKAYIEGLLK